MGPQCREGMTQGGDESSTKAWTSALRQLPDYDNPLAFTQSGNPTWRITAPVQGTLLLFLSLLSFYQKAMYAVSRVLSRSSVPDIGVGVLLRSPLQDLDYVWGHSACPHLHSLSIPQQALLYRSQSCRCCRKHYYSSRIVCINCVYSSTEWSFRVQSGF